jgi:hypothetical protein
MIFREGALENSTQANGEVSPRAAQKARKIDSQTMIVSHQVAMFANNSHSFGLLNELLVLAEHAGRKSSKGRSKVRRP